MVFFFQLIIFKYFHKIYIIQLDSYYGNHSPFLVRILIFIIYICLLGNIQGLMSKQENNDREDQAHKIPRQILNSKKGSKKMAKKQMSDVSSKKQRKLTTYFNANSLSTAYENSSDLEEGKINQLKEQLILRDKQIEKIREQKQFYQNKCSCLIMQNRSFKMKAKQMLIKVLSEQAQNKRRIKNKIDPKLGYFSEGKIFIEGSDIVSLKTFIETKAQQSQKLQMQLKKSKSDEQKDRIKFAISFIKKQIAEKQNQLKIKQKQLNLYKIRLRLMNEQAKCYYAENKWSVIKDSEGNERYLPMELIGKGGFGQVYKCYDLQDQQYVAIKINHVKLASNSDDMQNMQNFIKHVRRQVQTHQELQHRNIARIKQTLQVSNSRIIFVLEYCTGPQLSIMIKERRCIQQKDAKIIIYQILTALNYLNSLDQKVIHYDLKPSNIIFDRGVVKILDFGLCKLMDSEDSRMELTSPGLGTYWYLPPETFIFQNSTITSKVDVWSTGVIFFQMLYGRRPFANGVSQVKIIKQDLISKQAKRLQFPSDNPNKYKISQEAKEFIQQCLCYSPQDRLSVSQAFTHPYFA